MAKLLLQLLLLLLQLVVWMMLVPLPLLLGLVMLLLLLMGRGSHSTAHDRRSRGRMLEETLLVTEEAMNIALLLSRMGALHEAQLAVVDHVPEGWEESISIKTQVLFTIKELPQLIHRVGADVLATVLQSALQIGQVAKHTALVHNAAANALGDLHLVHLIVIVTRHGSALGIATLHGFQGAHAAVFL